MMNTALLLLTIFTKEICANEVIIPGFHFHSDRKEHFPIPKHEMDGHKNNPNSNWMFDFDKDSHCVRMDVKPFTLPMKWTVCYKSNHDFVDLLIPLSLQSTKSGNSLVESFKNKT